MPPDPALVGDRLEVVGPSLAAIRVWVTGRNTSVVFDDVPPPFQVVGFGTDAVVVRHPSLPELVLKVYAAEKVRCLADEFEAYERLAGSPFFPTCFGRGERHLMLSYERGPTLLDCLVRGIPVPKEAMDGVEAARAHARAVGLHPKDIHLKNVVLQGTGVKVLDLSRYLVAGEDPVWDHIVVGYRRLYPLLRGRPVPMGLVDLAKRLYRARRPDASIDQFLDRIARHRLLRLLVDDGDAHHAVGSAVTVPVLSPNQ